MDVEKSTLNPSLQNEKSTSEPGSILKDTLDGVPVPKRVKTATRQMIICNF